MGMGRIASSGMDAAMQEMEVISNNIANQGTAGFKQSSINFSDLFPAGSNGSGNAIGMGVDIGNVKQNFSAVGSTATGIETNMAINGSGFFIVKDPTSGQSVYSRNGAFSFNSSNPYLMLGTQRLQGFPAVNGSVLSGASPQDLLINTSPVPAIATTVVTSTGVNLNSLHTAPTNSPFNPADSTTYNLSSSVTVYDSLGNPTNVNMYYVKTSTANQWSMYAAIGSTVLNAGGTTMTFNTSGALTTPSAPVSLSFSPTTGAASPQTFTVNFAGTTQNGGTDSSGSFSPNGSVPGTFKQVTIDKNGQVSALYTNGTSVVQGQVALANFDNPQGLNYLGNSQWASTSTAGAPQVTVSNSTGNITPGSLENSNVNVADQLVGLINAQNAFQADAQAEQVFTQIMQTVTKL